MSAPALNMLGSIGAEAVSPLVTTRSLALGANATDLAVGGSPEAPVIAVTLGDGCVVLASVTVATGGLPGLSAQKQVSLTSARLSAHRVAAVAVSRFGDGFVTAGQDGRVAKLSPATGNPDTGTDPETGKDPDIGTDIGSGAGTGSGTGAAAAWLEQELFDADGDWIEVLEADETNGRIAIAHGRTVVVADAAGATHITATMETTVTGVSFIGDGRRIAVSHYNGVTLVSLTDASDRSELIWKGAHIGVTTSPDGRYVVTATQEKELHVWDLVTLQDYRMGGYPRKTRSFDWMVSGDILCCSGADVVTAWSFAGAGPGRKPPLEVGFVFGGTVSAVATHPTRPYVAAGFSCGNVQIGAVQKGEAIAAKSRTNATVSALDWSPCGAWLASADVAGALTVYAVPSELGVT